MFDAQLWLAAQENCAKEPSSHSMGKTHKYTLSPVLLEHHGQDQVAKTLDSNNDRLVVAAFLLLMDDPIVSLPQRNDVPMALLMTVEVQVTSRSPLKSCRLRCMLLIVHLVVEEIACKVFLPSFVIDADLGSANRGQASSVSFRRFSELSVQATVIADGITI